ncbi:MAG: hypothetical protein Q7U04_09770 [Bacteriovorax sp.]|nr:hypothetical protein [Bacteriovorax sp.]
MKKALFFLMGLVLVTFTTLKAVEQTSLPEKNADKAIDTAEAKAVMNNVYDSFVNIIPYVYADKFAFETLKSSSAQKTLIKNLTDISNSFKEARHVQYFQKPGFRPSLDTINSHIDETIVSIKSENMTFALSRLKAITALCVSCHSLLSESASKNAFGEAINSEKRTRFESDYAFANYLFLVRRFSEATVYFDKTIRHHLELGQNTDLQNEQEIQSSLRRVLSIYTKITFNPDASVAFLKKYKDHQFLKPQLKMTITQWISSLDKWKKFDPHKIKSIHLFITKYLAPLEAQKEKLLSGESDITLLIASGVLSKYINDNPLSPYGPEVLYWMAIAERRLSNTYFFSLSDLYLKDCITLYPKNPIAKKCYQEYEDNITFGFSGSKGTDIPNEEKKELDRLKSVLK